jgi:hypothetical protein
MAQKRDAYYFDDPDEVSDEVPPGHSVRVPLHLCDTVRFEPRPLSGLTDLSAADLDRHRPGYRLSDRASKSDKLSDLDAAGRDAHTATRDAYFEMVKRAENAWRTPPTRDTAEPDLGSRPEELMRAHLRAEEIDEAQARRDRAWAAYRDQLSNAWRTDPGRATAIERQAEMWRGGR